MDGVKPPRPAGLTDVLRQLGTCRPRPNLENAEQPTAISAPLKVALDEIRTLVNERHRKYGSLNIANSPGGALNGVRVRLFDKLARLSQAVDSGELDYADESLRDCLLDVVGYGLIGLLVVDGNWPSA